MPRYFVSMYTDGPATRWNVIDRQTQEWVRRFPTEQEAREYASKLEIQNAGNNASVADVSDQQDVRWAVNVLLEKIAEKFEGWETLDLFRSEAAATVRGFKHDLSSPLPSHQRTQGE